MDEKTVQGQITAFWDEVASTYDSPDNVALPATADYASWVSALRSVLPAQSARVLDVGTGTGFVARIAAELGHRVTAIDLSEAMLKASAVRDSELDVTFVVGDAVKPAFQWEALTPSSAAACCGHCANPSGPSETGTSC